MSSPRSWYVQLAQIRSTKNHGSLQKLYTSFVRELDREMIRTTAQLHEAAHEVTQALNKILLGLYTWMGTRVCIRTCTYVCEHEHNACAFALDAPTL